MVVLHERNFFLMKFNGNKRVKFSAEDADKDTVW